MDLSDISRERTLSDLGVARFRILDLTMKVDRAAAELEKLRGDLADLRGSVDGDESLALASVNSGSRSTWLGLSRLRFWGRSRQRGPIRWHVDEICGQLPARSKRGIHHSVKRGGSWALTLSGWAVPNGTAPAFTSMRLHLAGPNGLLTRQVSMHYREDVAAHFANPGFAVSGFRFELPMAELALGEYLVDLVGFAPQSGEVTTRLGRVELV